MLTAQLIAALAVALVLRPNAGPALGRPLRRVRAPTALACDAADPPPTDEVSTRTELQTLIIPVAGKGLGAFADEARAAGEWVTEYVGEKLTLEEVLERYEDGMGQYLFRVGADYLDGMESKHMSRYFNHAQHGNLNFTVDVENSRVDFYAMNNIEKGDELTFDYGTGYWLGRPKPLDDKRDLTLKRDNVTDVPPPFTPLNASAVESALALPPDESRAALFRGLDYYSAVQRIDTAGSINVSFGLGADASRVIVDSTRKGGLAKLAEALQKCIEEDDAAKEAEVEAV